MPRVTPLQKIERTKRFGGKYMEVVLEGDTFDDAQKGALKFATQKRLEYIAPFDNPKTIVGNGTVGLEIFKQL